MEGFYHLTLHACAVAQGHDDHSAFLIETMELFVTDKAQHLYSLLLSQGQNLLCRLTAHNPETKIRKLSSH